MPLRQQADGKENSVSPWRTRRLVAQKSAMRYDREGDNHYDIASALHEVHARL